MAKSLRVFAFTERSKSLPWDRLLDGRIWRLTAGEDYSCTDWRMESTARTAAARRGFRLKVNVLEGAVEIQAVSRRSEMPHRNRPRKSVRRELLES